MDVGDWLRRLGLEQYEATFRENAISDKVLPNLTAEDLKDMGVGMVGHRRILLDAIAALRAAEAAPTPPSDASLANHEVAKDSAERRQVTVMFSDLVGSTALSTRLDPEDLRDVLSAYQACVGDIVVRFGGFVARYLGDGVLIYFGYPVAHEDDAERAVRAGLALIDAVATLSAKDPLQVRIGVATGVVVVGDLVGSGEGQERGIVGETPNLASRLQGIAEPNMIIIAEATRKLLGNLFELRDLGLRELKGITTPVRAFAALRASSVASRFEAMHPGGLTAIVGREEELDLLLRRWVKAKTGEGQVVLLSGEAGIGKSRLHAAFIEGLAAEPHTRMRYFCSPQHTDSAFYPIMGQVERSAGFAQGDTLQAKLDKLDALLARTSTSRHDGALFAEMMLLPNDGRYPVLELAPELRRQKTLEALDLQVEALARSKPLLMIVEDVHWSDPTSLESLGRIVDRIENLRVLLIITFRPEFEAPWIGQPHVTVLALNRLGHRDVGTMIDRVVGDKPLPADVRKDIIERTDGIPLFVEEITKAVLEAGSELDATQTAAVPSPVMAVPASLHASLMARLDRLGRAKEVAQVGAAIGREFSHTLLAAVVLADLDLSLSRLVEAGLLFRKGVPPHATYLFKHALVQEAAYGTLLRQPRRALHASIADVLEQQFTETAEAHPDVLARHYTEAGLIDKAARLWGKAALRSIERSALAEAFEQLTRALGQIATLPREPALRREEIKLQVALIYTLQNVKGQAAPETRAAAERALLLIEEAEALGEPPEDPLLLFSTLYSLWQTYIAGFNGDVARQHAARILTLAEKQEAKVPLMHGHAAMGCSLLLTGNLVEALRHYDRVIALCDSVEHRPLKTQLSMDPQVAALIYGSLGRWMLGYPVTAFESAKQGLSKAREAGNPAILMHAIALACLTQLISGNYTLAKQQTDELVELAEEKGSAYWKASGMLRRAGLLALTEKSSDAVSILTSAIGGRPGTTLYSPIWLSCLARACGELGQFDDAWSYIGEAITAVEATKEKWYEAEIHRIAGEIALMLPERDTVKAEACFKRALAAARAQQAKSWDLRASISMARLWREQGKRDEARDLLAPVYGWFVEGFDTLDLRQAKVILDELTQVEQA